MTLFLLYSETLLFFHISFSGDILAPVFLNPLFRDPDTKRKTTTMSDPWIPARMPPPGVTSNFIDPVNTGYQQTICNVLCSIFVAIFVGMRIYTRVKLVKCVSWDDCKHSNSSCSRRIFAIEWLVDAKSRSYHRGNTGVLCRCRMFSIHHQSRLGTYESFQMLLDPSLTHSIG